MCVLPNRQKKKVMEKIELEKKKYIFYRGFKRSRTSENKAPPKMGSIFLNSQKSTGPKSTNTYEANHKPCKRRNIYIYIVLTKDTLEKSLYMGKVHTNCAVVNHF